MPDERIGFDLVSEAWIPVRLLDGTACEVGLLDALVNAHEIAGLDIEFPTQEPALLRVLLAICYRALEGPRDDDSWEMLWAAETLPAEAITSYLGRWQERFDLFHPETPFFQSPQLEPVGKDGVKPASKLISHAPAGNNVPVFTPITDAMALTLRPSEAARWLIERHAWGTASDKTGAVGNPKVKAGKDTPQVGYLGWIGFVAPIGRTLRETLLLNLVPSNRTALVSIGLEDRPAWERPPTGGAREDRPPLGTCDLFTWQGRRIRLFSKRQGDDVVVHQVLVCAGDDVQRNSVRIVDPHTGWRMKKERDGTLTYLPTKARMGQQVWRGLSAMLALDDDTQRAGVLSWLTAVGDKGVSQVSLLVTAAEFGSMSTTVADFVSDRLDTAIAILRTENLEVATLANDAASFAERAARALWNVADGPFLSFNHEHERYSVAEGNAQQARGARDAISEEFYGELDAPFRRFLVELGSADDLSVTRRQWADDLAAIACEVAQGYLSRFTSAEAFTGAMAEGWFRRALRGACQVFSPIEAIQEVMA